MEGITGISLSERMSALLLPALSRILTQTLVFKAKLCGPEAVCAAGAVTKLSSSVEMVMLSQLSTSSRSFRIPDCTRRCRESRV